MPDNTFDSLTALLNKVRCKPGWTFALDDDPKDGFRLCIRVPCENSRIPGQGITIRHYFPIPYATYNDLTWRRWVFNCCLKVETHEIGEFFMVGDERPFAPLHGPGEDPYTIHEFRPESDARTNQDGSVNAPPDRV